MLLPQHKATYHVHEEAELGPPAWLSGLDHSDRLKKSYCSLWPLRTLFCISEQEVGSNLPMNGPPTAAFQETFYENVLKVPHGNVSLMLTESPFSLSPVTQRQGKLENYARERKTSPLICFTKFIKETVVPQAVAPTTHRQTTDCMVQDFVPKHMPGDWKRRKGCVMCVSGRQAGTAGLCSWTKVCEDLVDLQ